MTFDLSKWPGRLRATAAAAPLTARLALSVARADSGARAEGVRLDGHTDADKLGNIPGGVLAGWKPRFRNVAGRRRRKNP